MAKFIRIGDGNVLNLDYVKSAFIQAETNGIEQQDDPWGQKTEYQPTGRHHVFAITTDGQVLLDSFDSSGDAELYMQNVFGT